MWGTDGVRRASRWTTAWGWIFTAYRALERSSASAGMCASEATASHALQAGIAPWGLRGCTALDLQDRCGAGAGLDGWITDLAQYLSDGNFTNLLSSSGKIQPSYAFVEQPQTNGVAERFNRTLKEQIIHVPHLAATSRSCGNARPRVRRTVHLPSGCVEKNGYLSPAQARQAWHTAMVTQASPHETNLCPRNRVRYTNSFGFIRREVLTSYDFWKRRAMKLYIFKCRSRLAFASCQVLIHRLSRETSRYV